MRDFNEAKKLFLDTVQTSEYFDSLSAKSTKRKLLSCIKDKNIPLIFLLGDPGTGKTYMLNYIFKQIKQKVITIFIKEPFFDKNDLIKILSSAIGKQEAILDFDTLKKEYKQKDNIIFIDEAQMLTHTQMEMIRILSDSRIFRFVLAMHKKEGHTILNKAHFKSRTKEVIYTDNLEIGEVSRYIQSRLLSNSLADIASMFQKSHFKKIAKFTNGNFREIKKLISTLFDLLEYAKTNSLSKYQTINDCLLNMAAMKLKMTTDKFDELERKCKRKVFYKWIKMALFLMIAVFAILGVWFWLFNTQTTQKPKIENKKHTKQNKTQNTKQKKENILYLAPKVEIEKIKIETKNKKQKKKDIKQEKKEKRLEATKAIQTTQKFSFSAKTYDDETVLLKRFESENSYDAAIKLSAYYFKKKEYKNCVTWAIKASSKNPKADKPWILFAKSKLKLGNKQNAIKALKAYLYHSSSDEISELLKKIEGDSK